MQTIELGAIRGEQHRQDNGQEQPAHPVQRYDPRLVLAWPTLSVPVALVAGHLSETDGIRRLHALVALARRRLSALTKTGTLTAGEMTVTRIGVVDAEFEVTGTGYASPRQARSAQ